MSIKETQVLERDTLNRAFVSKSATGTQIMAGSLRLLGGLTIDGTLITNLLDAGASQIKTTGRIDAGTFYGSGAGLTNLPAGNLTGTIADARLSSNIMLLNTAQIVASTKTFVGEQKFYIGTWADPHSGVGYAIKYSGGTAGDFIRLSGSLTVLGAVDIVGNKIEFGGSAHRQDKISLYKGSGADARYLIGTETYHITYGGGAAEASSTGHKFFRGSNEVIAQLGNGQSSGTAADRLDSRFFGNVAIGGSLEVEGELKSGGVNEFPDPLVASDSTSYWPQVAGGTYVTDVQVPSDTGAFRSIKITVSSTDVRAYLYSSGTLHQVSPGEWITFSAYAFTTASGKQGRMTIRWKNSAGAEVGRTDLFHDLTTSWKRYRVTGQAPATATQFDVAITAEVAGTVVYWSAFQVERGRAMTAFKPFTGGNDSASLFGTNLKMGTGGGLHSSKNHQAIIQDHNNGNITLSAASGNLYLGYTNTSKVVLYSPLYTGNSSTIIASTDGKLYYQGADIDARYFQLAGGTITGATTFSSTVTANSGFTANTFDASVIRGGSAASRINVYNNTGSANSATWIEMWGADGTARAGELTLASNYVAFRTGNVTGTQPETMRLTSNGLYIGGGATASRKLHVNGDARIGTTLEVGTGTQANDLTVTSGGNLNFRNMLYSTNTAVGIGTTSPAHALDVTGNVNVTGRAMIKGYAVFSTFTDLINDSPWYGVGITNVANGTGKFVQLAGYYGLILKTSNNELRITSSGDVTVNSSRILVTADTGHKTSGNYIDADRVDGKHASDLMQSTVYREKYTVPVGGIASGTQITIPTARTYVLGTNRLQVFRDGILQELGEDYNEVTTTKVAFLYNLPEDTRLTFIIQNAG